MSTVDDNPRTWMKIAVEVMKNSVSEPREDGKVSPKVGAVLVKSHGKYEKACRGELRDGDHAEYTLIERMNRAEKLDETVLYTTLEPCAPGARKPPKLGCAERIVLARIPEVWVGIEDPDPTVDRKGIKYLQDNGVTVKMFDADLQRAIERENREFLKQARERATESDEDTAPEVVLSGLEGASTKARLEDLSAEALTAYGQQVGLADRTAVLDRLARQGLLLGDRDGRIPTDLAVVLFAERPRDFLPQAGLLATAHYSDGSIEPEDFNLPLIDIPGRVMEWLQQKVLRVTIDRTRPARSESLEIPAEALREAIINALVHRDYDIVGAKCQLLVTHDTIVIKSPGEPVPPVDLEAMRAFKAPTLSRNPKLMYVFGQLKMVEERGLGMFTWRGLEEKGLPAPKYSSEPPFLVLTVYRHADAVIADLPSEVREALSEEEKRGWLFLRSRDEVTARQYAEGMGLENRTAQRQLKAFVELGLLRRTGQGRTTKYLVGQR